MTNVHSSNENRFRTESIRSDFTYLILIQNEFARPLPLLNLSQKRNEFLVFTLTILRIALCVLGAIKVEQHIKYSDSVLRGFVIKPGGYVLLLLPFYIDFFGFLTTYSGFIRSTIF